MPAAQSTAFMAEIHRLSAVQLRDSLRSGELSAREATAHFLARIAERNPLLGAFVTVTAEQAMADAGAADALYSRLRRGLGADGTDNRPEEPLTPFRSSTACRWPSRTSLMWPAW